MRNFLVLLLFLKLLNLALFGQVIFSEVMYNVAGSDYHDEFVEIFNTSKSEAIDINLWQFSDSVGTDLLVDAGFGTLLLPGQFAVILDGSYFAHSSRYDDQIPDSALIVKIDNDTFGSSGLSNSHAERLYLINILGDTVQSYRYFPDNVEDYSDEKIDFSLGNASENWAQSLRKGGTPGYRNSVTPFTHDLKVSESSITFHPESLINSGQTVYFDLSVLNAGQEGFSDSLRIQFFIDANHDSIWQAPERLVIDSIYTLDLKPQEIFRVQAEWYPEKAGPYFLILRIAAGKDQNALNNLAEISLFVFESEETIAINEIKFLTVEDEPEWVELYNYGPRAINLYGWSIADPIDTSKIDSMVLLNPNQFKLFAADSLTHWFPDLVDSLVLVLPDFPHLNNAQDVVYLLNPGLGWVEQVPYWNSWLEGEDWKYPSLERINPFLDSRKAADWGPCTNPNLGTPGASNSIFTPLDHELKSHLTCKPSPFSPDGDGIEDYTIIQISAPALSARIRLRIYDINGHRVRTLSESGFIGSKISVVWDGKTDNGNICRMGIYIILAEILNDRSGILISEKTTVVLGANM